MVQVTFITGNQPKADYLAKYLGHPVDHFKLDLDEIQSLDSKTIVEHKVRQAYDQIKKPVLVEDVSLEFVAWGRLPGPLIKWFLEELSLQQICDMLNGQNRDAVGRCTFGYFDGKRLELFEGSVAGTIAEKPGGDSGFGWDPLFIVDGYDVTRAELSEKDYQKVYLRIRPFAELKKFLESLDS
jgi:inosine triphosphate pyrophosphatase